MSPTDELIPILKKLRMSGVLQSLQERTRQAVDDDLSHSEFLYYLLHDEIERREAKQLSLRLKRASFEHNKSLEAFDFIAAAALRAWRRALLHLVSATRSPCRARDARGRLPAGSFCLS